MLLLDVILGHTPLTLPLLTADQTFRLRLLRIRCSDFAFIWIRCSDFICITFASTVVKRSNFVFCILGIQTLALHGLDVQTSSVSYLLTP